MQERLDSGIRPRHRPCILSHPTGVWTGRIDSGDPLLLKNPPTTEGVAAYAVDTAVCDNPECP